MQNPTDDPCLQAEPAAPADGSAAPRVLVQGIEPAVAELFEAWLELDGIRAQRHADAGEDLALILVELPFPRQHGATHVRQLARDWPGVPVLVLSPTFLPGVAAHGEVARQLGAAAVLATPVARDTLRAAVAHLLRRSAMP